MSWLVAHLFDNEFRVSDRLDKARQDHFLPTYTTREGIVKPLYPGYLFVRYHHRWPDILGIEGVGAILGEPGPDYYRPHMLADEFIDSLREYEPVIEPDVLDRFAEGDMVRITAGPHQGLFGTFQRRKHGDGIVMVDYFQRSVRISIPLHLLANPLYGGSALGETRQRAGA